MPKTVLGLLAAMGVAALAGCAGGVYATGPVGYYDYDYYPDWDVYFYPHERVYYWYDGGHWRHGHRVPYHYHLNEEQREHLQLHSREPWREHYPEHHEFEGHYRHDRR